VEGCAVWKRILAAVPERARTSPAEGELVSPSWPRDSAMASTVSAARSPRCDWDHNVRIQYLNPSPVGLFFVPSSTRRWSATADSSRLRLRSLPRRARTSKLRPWRGQHLP